MRIPFDRVTETLQEILIKYGTTPENARECALLFAQTSADGVYSHGVNRFPRLISYIQKGYVQPNAQPVTLSRAGSFERWDGKLGLGNLNAKRAMTRACELARLHGLGLVAIGNTNHWMRGGSYGWQAADSGCIGICWTNTTPNMPPWGAVDCKLGNNPLVLAVPRSNGAHVVFDCAMSQFAYGKLEEARMKGQKLPVPGGYDTQGRITSDPAAIEQSRRALPMGYWKGSGLSLLLDLIVSILSGAKSTMDIGRQCEEEYGLSQVMVAVDPRHMNTSAITDAIVTQVIEDIKSATPIDPAGEIRYPGERELRARIENMREGIPVLRSVWEKIQGL